MTLSKSEPSNYHLLSSQIIDVIKTKERHKAASVSRLTTPWAISASQQKRKQPSESLQQSAASIPIRVNVTVISLQCPRSTYSTTTTNHNHNNNNKARTSSRWSSTARSTICSISRRSHPPPPPPPIPPPWRRWGEQVGVMGGAIWTRSSASARRTSACSTTTEPQLPARRAVRVPLLQHARRRRHRTCRISPTPALAAPFIQPCAHARSWIDVMRVVWTGWLEYTHTQGGWVASNKANEAISGSTSAPKNGGCAGGVLRVCREV